jgi:hypothetical protein
MSSRPKDVRACLGEGDGDWSAQTGRCSGHKRNAFVQFEIIEY